MQKVLIIIIFISFLFSCKNLKKEETDKIKDSKNKEAENYEEYPVTDENKYGIVTADIGLNLREKPDTSSKIIVIMPFKATFELLNEVNKEEKMDNSIANWYKIRWNNKEGYVFGAYFQQIMKRLPKKIENIQFSFSPYDCSGLTESEYGIVLLFKDGNVSIKGFYPNSRNIQEGTYIIKKDHIILNILKKKNITTKEFSDVIINTKEENVNVLYIAYPILCKSRDEILKEGFFIPDISATARWVVPDKY